jgi:hypothetical protein
VRIYNQGLELAINRRLRPPRLLMKLEAWKYSRGAGPHSPHPPPTASLKRVGESEWVAKASGCHTWHGDGCAVESMVGLKLTWCTAHKRLQSPVAPSYS